MLADVGDEHEPSIDITRRGLLVGTGAALIAFMAGCSGDDAGRGATTVPADDTTPRPAPDLSGDPFTLGVASGDPLPSAVVLWTRLAPEPLADDGLGGMPAEEVDVTWEVATDDGFTTLVRSGVAVATPDHAHSVHVDVDGLDPATDYYYRFPSASYTSPVGAHPDPARRVLPTRFGLAVVNCQWFETGTYAAYRHLLDEEVDLVAAPRRLHLRVPERRTGRAARPCPAHAVETLADYRLRYASYALDEDLRNAHARFPFVLTWDDHEVSNNYIGDGLVEQPDSPEAAAASARRRPTRRGGSTCRSGSARPTGASSWSTSTSTSATSPASTCSTSASTATCRRVGTAIRRRTTSATAPSGRERPHAARRRPGGVVRRGERRAARRTWNLIGNPVVLAGDRRRQRHRRRRLLPRHVGRVPDGPPPLHRAARRHRQPGRAHRRLPRRDGARRPRATVRAGHAGRGHRAHGPADLVAPVPGGRQRAQPRSCASSSTATATSSVDVDARRGCTRRSGCSTT